MRPRTVSRAKVAQPVNKSGLEKQSANQIRVDEAFFHRFFTYANAEKAAHSEGVDDSQTEGGVESSDDGEPDKYANEDEFADMLAEKLMREQAGALDGEDDEMPDFSDVGSDAEEGAGDSGSDGTEMSEDGDAEDDFALVNDDDVAGFLEDEFLEDESFDEVDDGGVALEGAL